jgi:hypothetical protein
MFLHSEFHFNHRSRTSASLLFFSIKSTLTLSTSSPGLPNQYEEVWFYSWLSRIQGMVCVFYRKEPLMSNIETKI